MKSEIFMRDMKSPVAAAKRKAVLKNILWICLFAALVLLFYRCPFKMITGIDCPGCGLTRAFGCIILGDFYAAVSYHPLSPLIFTEFFYLIYYQFVLKRKIKDKIIIIITAVTALLMLAFWLHKII